MVHLLLYLFNGISRQYKQQKLKYFDQLFCDNDFSTIWPTIDRHQPKVRFSKVKIIDLKFNHKMPILTKNSKVSVAKVIHRRPSIKDVHTRGEGGGWSKADTCGGRGRGVSGKKRTSANSNFHLNFRSLDSGKERGETGCGEL